MNFIIKSIIQAVWQFQGQILRLGKGIRSETEQKKIL